MDATGTSVNVTQLVDAGLTSNIEFSTVVDHAWLLISAFLVFMMQAGFSILEVGTIRAKNAKNIMIKNVLDACAGAFMWWGFGYAFAYGGGSYTGGPPNGFIGAKDFFFINGYTDCDSSVDLCLYPVEPSTGGSYAMWIFQWAFAATAATIVAGSVAERCTIVAYLTYSCVLTGFIYPVVVHWIWSDYGWLSAGRDADVARGAWVQSGVVDFAGSGVVHMVGGCAALMGAIFLGPRIGRFDADGRMVKFSPHNAAFIGLGTLLLWFGWYGFNPGSTLGLSGGMVLLAEKVAVGTTLAAAAGGLSAMLNSFVAYRHLDLGPLCNGILAGLVGVCSGVSVSEPWGCFAIGFFCSMFQFWVAIGVQKLQIDDPLDAFAVHGGAGFFGLICGGLFGTRMNTDAAYSSDQPCGAFFNGCGGQQLGVNILGGVMIALWVCGTCTILFGTMRLAGILRISREEELAGLDKSRHGGYAYDIKGSQDEPSSKALEV